MQIIDYVFIAIAVIGLIIGLIRGVISQLLALLGVFAVAVGTSYLFKFPMKWLSPVVHNDTVLTIVSIALTAIVLLVIYCIIVKLVKKPFKSIKILKGVDKAIGGIVGVAVAYAAIALFVAALTTLTDVKVFAKLSEWLGPQIQKSVVVNILYPKNLFGNWILGVIRQGIDYARGFVK